MWRNPKGKQLTCKPMANRIKIALAVMAILLIQGGQSAMAQFKAKAAGTPEEMALETFENSSVKIRNMRFRGNPEAVALFASQNGKPAYEEGLIISTGKALQTAGPNDQPKISHVVGSPGDRNLDGVGRNRTFDAAILEFDFMCARDSLGIEFFFASDEYNEMVGNTFGDVIGIWVFGPDLGQGVNLAKLPDGRFISVNAVNHNLNREYFVDNNPFNLNGERLPNLEAKMDASVLENFQYDGLTQPFSVGLRVKPKEIYHIKIGIADCGDGEVDSGVFFKKGGFTSPEQLWHQRLREAREAKRIADSLARAEFIADSIAHEQWVADSIQHAQFVADSIQHAQFVADSLEREMRIADSPAQLPETPPMIEEETPQEEAQPQQDPVEEPRNAESDRIRRWGPDDGQPARPKALFEGNPPQESEQEDNPTTAEEPKEGPDLGELDMDAPLPEPIPVQDLLVQFDSGSSRIPEAVRSRLQTIAEELTAHPEIKADLYVIGDSELEQLVRTSAVKYYLIGAGAPEKQLDVIENTIPENPPAIHFEYEGEVQILVRTQRK